MTNEIRIYVADLAAYNAGHLHGSWIDATLDVEDIQEQISSMLGCSPVEGAEEYAIHDYEGFDGYGVGEYEGIEAVHEIALFIEQHPAFGGALLNQVSDLDEAKRAADENYCGCYKSLADYAEEVTEAATVIPEPLRNYIDYESMAQDMTLNGDLFTVEAGFEEVHIFWNR